MKEVMKKKTRATFSFLKKTLLINNSKNNNLFMITPQDSIQLPLREEKIRYERFIPRRPITTFLVGTCLVISTIYGIYNYNIGKRIRQY